MSVPESRLVVLQSVRKPSSRTNPYIIQLVDSLAEHVDVRYFDWRFGLLGHYDLLHLHWPEVMLRRDGRVQRWSAMARFFLLMLRLTLTRRIAVVRTLHNVGVHESGGRVERLLLAWCDRRTDGWIALNPQTRAPRGARPTVILHGDYTTWFASYPVPSRRPGRLLYFGLIRPYKGIDGLLAAYAATDDPDSRLRIVGKPVNRGLTETVEAAEATDARISALLDYVDDETLANEVGQADLVVLPYQDMHNSGALLLALSLGRPVLVPQAPVTVALAEEVGPEWVHTYPDSLTPEALTKALVAVAAPANGRASTPDLSRRSWDLIAAQHQAVYRELAGTKGFS